MWEVLIDAGLHGGFEVIGLLVIGLCYARWRHSTVAGEEE
jgi:hypothetical protein